MNYEVEFFSFLFHSIDFVAKEYLTKVIVTLCQAVELLVLLAN